MDKIAAYISQYLIKQNIIEKDEQELYEYGTILLLEGCLSILLCLYISNYFDSLFEGIFILIIFIPIRILGGGLHVNSYIFCLCLTCFTVIAILLISTFFEFNKNFLLFIALFSLITIKSLYPVEHPNRPVSQLENLLFKNKFNIVLSYNLLLTLVLFSSELFPIFSVTLLTLALSMLLGKILN